jgi:hypothetical protein
MKKEANMGAQLSTAVLLMSAVKVWALPDAGATVARNTLAVEGVGGIIVQAIPVRDVFQDIGNSFEQNVKKPLKHVGKEIGIGLENTRKETERAGRKINMAVVAIGEGGQHLVQQSGHVIEDTAHWAGDHPFEAALIVGAAFTCGATLVDLYAVEFSVAATAGGGTAVVGITLFKSESDKKSASAERSNPESKGSAPVSPQSKKTATVVTLPEPGKVPEEQRAQVADKILDLLKYETEGELKLYPNVPDDPRLKELKSAYPHTSTSNLPFFLSGSVTALRSTLDVLASEEVGRQIIKQTLGDQQKMKIFDGVQERYLSAHKMLEGYRKESYANAIPREKRDEIQRRVGELWNNNDHTLKTIFGADTIRPDVKDGSVRAAEALNKIDQDVRNARIKNGAKAIQDAMKKNGGPGYPVLPLEEIERRIRATE